MVDRQAMLYDAISPLTGCCRQPPACAVLRAKGTRRVTTQARDGGARVTTVRKVLRRR